VSTECNGSLESKGLSTVAVWEPGALRVPGCGGRVDRASAVERRSFAAQQVSEATAPRPDRYVAFHLRHFAILECIDEFGERINRHPSRPSDVDGAQLARSDQLVRLSAPKLSLSAASSTLSSSFSIGQILFQLR